MAATIYLRYVTDPDYAAEVDASSEPRNALVWLHQRPCTALSNDEHDRLMTLLDVMVVSQGSGLRLLSEVRRVMPVLERAERSGHWGDFTAGTGVSTLNGLRMAAGLVR